MSRGFWRQTIPKLQRRRAMRVVLAVCACSDAAQLLPFVQRTAVLHHATYNQPTFRGASLLTRLPRRCGVGGSCSKIAQGRPSEGKGREGKNKKGFFRGAGGKNQESCKMLALDLLVLVFSTGTTLILLMVVAWPKWLKSNSRGTTCDISASCVGSRRSSWLRSAGAEKEKKNY